MLRVCSKTMDYSCDFATRPTTRGRKGRAGFMNKTAPIIHGLLFHLGLSCIALLNSYLTVARN
jgi:hypothetical protein